MIELLRSGSEEAKENASFGWFTPLIELLYYRIFSLNADNEVEVVRLGGFTPLIELLRSGSEVAKERASGALMNLSLMLTMTKRSFVWVVCLL